MDKTANTIRIFDDCAQLYQEKCMELELYHDTLDLFCQKVEKQGAEVLDLACGPGNVTQYLLKKRPDLKVLGTDLSEKMLLLARNNNPAADFQLLDMRRITDLNKLFDGIVCGFGLPYLSRVECLQLIADSARILNPGGVLYLSTMEDDYSKSGYQGSSSGGSQQLYLFYHEADFLTQVLDANGFKILELVRKDFQQADGKISIDLVILARLMKQ
jgi:ubiquinone/menaquinone biosynthesis C-methylase UbiE